MNLGIWLSRVVFNTTCTDKQFYWVCTCFWHIINCNVFIRSKYYRVSHISHTGVLVLSFSSQSSLFLKEQLHKSNNLFCERLMQHQDTISYTPLQTKSTIWEPMWGVIAGEWDICKKNRVKKSYLAEHQHWVHVDPKKVKILNVLEWCRMIMNGY